MPAGPVATWSKEDKIRATLERAKKYLGPALSSQVDALLQPENLALMAATLVIWAASHFLGVGEVVDVVLLLLGAAMLGPAVVDVAENLLKFGKCISARSEVDLDVSAKAFADAVVKGGITVVMAILLRRGAKSMQAARAPGVAAPSWLQVAKPRGPIGLPNVGVDPQPGALWSRLPVVADPSLPAGEGYTTAFGKIFYSAQGSVTEQMLVRLHETVHRLFSPRLGVLRTLRSRLRIAGYLNSVLLKYLEEALAETYAQLRVVGFNGLLTGIRFPVTNGYVSISELATEGISIGTIMLGVQRLTVCLVDGPPDWAADISAQRPGVMQGAPIVVTGGTSVTVPPGSSLSAIAKAQYGDFNLWPLIYDLNKDKIGKNPNIVAVGTKLLLLPLDRYTPAELAEARRRAPTWRAQSGA